LAVGLSIPQTGEKVGLQVTICAVRELFVGLSVAADRKLTA
jgi:hypothetical protein